MELYRPVSRRASTTEVVQEPDGIAGVAEPFPIVGRTEVGIDAGIGSGSLPGGGVGSIGLLVRSVALLVNASHVAGAMRPSAARRCASTKAATHSSHRTRPPCPT